MSTDTTRTAAIFLLCVVCVTACGGGGGSSSGGNGGGGGGGGNTARTYTAVLTDVELTDSRTGQAVQASGLPLNGATISRD